ncbi:hypothetical protein JCM3770_005914 [Rhodotorula araucariae]
MDAYLTSTKPGASASARAASVRPGAGKARPFASLAAAPKPLAASTSRNRIQGGVRDANNALMKTLGKDDNPITNSTAYQRSLHVSSCATGHQSGGGPGRKWTLHRNTKLRIQAADAESQTLKGVVAYMSGYTGDDITNTQLKALIEMQGGRIVTVASPRCTHIFITSNLSGSKAQKYLEASRKNGAKLVTPQWAVECARRGRRVSEAPFAAPVYNEMQESAYAIYSARGSASPSEASTSSSVSPPALADAPLASTSASSFFPPVPPRLRTRSQTGNTPASASPSAATEALLPAAPLSPHRAPSPRTRARPATATATVTAPRPKGGSTSATAHLLAQLAAQAAQRSPGRRSPGREARTGTKRRSTHVATWDQSSDRSYSDDAADLSPSSSPRRPTHSHSVRFDALRGNRLEGDASPAGVHAGRSGQKLEMLGEWRVGERIGRGASGSVRFAQSAVTGEYAAVKKVLRYPDGHQARLFPSIHPRRSSQLMGNCLQHSIPVQREINLMKLVASHPHFVHIFDVFETTTHYYIVTEFCSGGELYQYLAEQALSPHQAHRLFLQLISGLLYLRRFSLAHRDIKLENLLLCYDDEGEPILKLGDLGMATHQRIGELLTTSCGSPHYAAPEVVKPVPYDGLLADVWSAGVVLYALFARLLPFDDENHPALFKKIVNAEYAMHASIPPVAQDLIARCLVVDPRKRYTLDDILAHQFLRSQPYLPRALTATALYPPPPPRAPIPAADESLDPVVLACVAVLVKATTEDEAERLVRTTALAQHFYTVLLGFRLPRPSTPSDRAGRSYFDDDSFSISAHTSTDSSSDSSHSSLVSVLALFPTSPQRAPIVVSPESAAHRFHTALPLTLTSSDAGCLSSYESDEGVLPRTKLRWRPSSPPSMASDRPAVTISPPPRRDSLSTPTISHTSFVGVFPDPPPALRDASAVCPSFTSGASKSLPASPTTSSVEPRALSASHAPLVGNADVGSNSRAVRPRLSMQKRLRNIFQGPATKRASLRSVPEAAIGRFDSSYPPPKRQAASSPLRRQLSAPSRPSTAESLAPRNASPSSSSGRSTASRLRRSEGYPTLPRARKSEPPSPPVLSPFDEILTLGAPGPGVGALGESETAAAAAGSAAGRHQGGQIYQDPVLSTSSTPRTPPAQLRLQLPLTRDTVNALAPVPPSTPQRLLTKASSSLLVGIGRGRKVLPRPAPAGPVDNGEDPAGGGAGGGATPRGWRRLSLSIRVPAPAPSMPRADALAPCSCADGRRSPSQTSEALDAPSPSTSAPVFPAALLEAAQARASAAEAANRALRQALVGKDAEIARLRALCGEIGWMGAARAFADEEEGEGSLRY